MQQYISSSLSIGILGGGQLGKMLTDITRKWDIRTHILDSNAGAPAKNSCYRFVQGDLMDYETVLNFGKEVEVLTIEIEHVNIDALYELEKAGVLVYPKPATLDIIQNKQTQKAFFEQQKLPTAPFISCENKKELLAHISNGSVDFPFIWKAARFGYDGFGVKKIDRKAAIDALPDNPCIIETVVPIKQEIAIIAARNPDGEIALYPPVGMAFHPEANQVEYVYFPAEISKEIAKKAHDITHKLVSAWANVGLLAVEFFVDQENNLLINEVAPRPHNSGHLTITDSNNLKLHPRMKDFYKFFKYNGKIVDIFDYEESHLNIFSREILQKIKKNLSSDITLRLIDDYKIDGDFVESQAFAFLAIRSVQGLPISFPNTTGCKIPCVGGELIKN